MITLYHNPNCGTSRTVLEMLRQSGEAFEKVEYLDKGWTRSHLKELFKDAGLSARAALRIAHSPAEELGLLNPDIGEEALIDAMIAHPILVNRPFVVSPNGTRLCRPAALLFDLLPKGTLDQYVKPDGQILKRSL